MTNAALQAMIDEFGERIFAITFDNNHKVYLGVEAKAETDPITVKSLILKTFGDTDMLGIPHTDHTWEGNKIPYTNWYVTGCIQAVHLTDELGDLLPDLNKFF